MDADATTHRFLWGLCYRMSGNPADADELVQEAYARGLQAKNSSRPYLTRVAVNLSRDLLRQRKRRGYSGPWLPGPLQTEELASEDTPTDRYDLLESVSYAFLLALEALSPKQRAVLLLADVFDQSASEIAATLGIAEGHVRVIHHRAKKAMAAYDAARVRPTKAQQERTKQLLEKFVSLLLAQDQKAIEQLLKDDVESLSDGGGRYLAAKVPVIGRERVALLFKRLMQISSEVASADVIQLNGFPTLVVRFKSKHPTYPPLSTLGIDVAEDGLIRRVYSVSAPEKLHGLTSPH